MEYIQDIAFNDTCDKMAISTTSQKIILYQKVPKKSNELILIDNDLKEELNIKNNDNINSPQKTGSNSNSKNIYYTDKKKKRKSHNISIQTKFIPKRNESTIISTKIRKNSSRSLISIESSNNSKSQSKSISRKDFDYSKNETEDDDEDDEENTDLFSFFKSKNNSSNLFKSLNFGSKNNFKLDRINAGVNSEINDDSFDSLYNSSSISKYKKNKDYDYRWEKITSWTTDGPALRLQWASSEFGNIVACCGYNKCVYIIKEEKYDNQLIWKCSTKIVEFTDIVEDISFVPKNDSLELATITSDGFLKTFFPFPGRSSWQSNHILYFPKSRCTCLCCNPSNIDKLTIVVGFKKRFLFDEIKYDKNNIINDKPIKKQDSFKSISNDLLKIVYFKNNNNALIGAINETGIEDDITDVDWANQNGRLHHMICSTSKDGKFIIFEINLLYDELNSTDQGSNKNNSFFTSIKLFEYNHTKPLWRCSFNESGIICSCIDEDGEVLIFMKIGRNEFIKLDLNKKK